MYKTLIVASCILALSLATPLPENQQDAKKSDKRSVGAYHYETGAEVGYHNVPVVQNVNVPVTKHVSVPVTSHVSVPVTSHVSVPVRSSVSVPVVKNVAVPVVSYKTQVHYDSPAFYSSVYPSYGYSGYSGYHGVAGHVYY